ncbi:MAG: NADH-quinone oxidoreductase subunit NuoE [Sulfobacillus acidophilus]|uniref:NADH-quinone oxidoreductase subunit NuoE n=1 Tax=Sulfobacillus acidophilus TaxID=53633 RepID=A0A2T2WML2_9FIRM|nr:MAG: NADH-quinone oxidoreductase subunit NuoE [Sulfobacillus acidophilus]
MKPEWREWAAEARTEFPQAHSALLPLLHRVQRAEGWLSGETLADIAELLDLSPQYVQSVASFYSLYFKEPVGKKVVHVCMGLSCMLAGSDELMHQLEEKLGVSQGQTTADGEYTLLEGECLAACDLAPVAQVNLRYHGPVPPEKADTLLREEVSP